VNDVEGGVTRICDVAIVGAGAAGLATAYFAAAARLPLRVLLLDGAAHPGAKILVSGGSRCNVTNVRVRERDFFGGRVATIRRVLRAFPVPATVEWFTELGVALHEEEDGKLFPDTHRSRDVLSALLRGIESRGVPLVSSARVRGIRRTSGGFVLDSTRGLVEAARVVLATGGQSLPKTGSDGGGYVLASALGHTIVPTTPALAPLVSDENRGFHRELSGVSVGAVLSVWIDGALATSESGSLLFTHFGVSGPVALNVSRVWARARLERRAVDVRASFMPGVRFEVLDDRWIEAARARPTTAVRTVLASDVPDALALALLRSADVDAATRLAELTRDERRRLVHSTLDSLLPVIDTRGYSYAEATAGGGDLAEIDATTMASHVCEGLYLVGEILDVDGRVGGFNFQWAWASGKVAGSALAA
jgi:predicted Rossmann fold flavoprotein